MTTMSPAPTPRFPTGWTAWPVALPVVIAAAGAALACGLVWQEADRQHRERAEERLEFEAHDITQKVEQRMRTYRQVLRGAGALFDASDEVTRDDWRIYVAALALDRDFPGIQGIGFSRFVATDELAAHEAAMRAGQGPDYSIRPAGKRAEFSSIVFLEPLNWRNQRALSYDMLSEPVRRAAMDRARRTGQAALSGKVRLVQETNADIQSGVLLYLPIFRHGMPTDSEQARIAAISGWVFSPFRMGDLMTDTLGGASDALRMRIYDGTIATPEALLYDSHAGDPADSGALGHTRIQNIDGRDWLLSFVVRRDNAADINRWRMELTLMVTFSALLVMLTASLALSRQRAARLVRVSTSLTRSESMYSALVNLSGEGILSLDSEGLIEFANPGIYRTLDMAGDELAGRALASLGSDDKRDVLQSMSRTLLDGENVRVELMLRSSTGNDVAVLASGVPRRDREGRVTGAVIAISDISDRKADEARVAWLAMHDGLTALPNRSLLGDRLSRVLNSAQRYRRTFCVLFIDLDHFKDVNDRMGHHAGDNVLVEASRRMLACLRAADTLARHGGDEFVALLPEAGSLDAALSVAEKIRSQLCKPFEIDEGQAQISTSIGVVMFPDHGNDPETLLARADAAMYAAKSGGRDAIAVWSPNDAPQKALT
jgi:diguanylate cyclase (GGDEF)-like protein/PAS domain S-box-containing protein